MAAWWMLLTSARLLQTRTAGFWGDWGQCRRVTRSTESRGTKRWQWPDCSPLWLAAMSWFEIKALLPGATHQVSLGGHGNEDDVVADPDLLSLGPLLGGGVHGPPAGLACHSALGYKKKTGTGKYSDVWWDDDAHISIILFARMFGQTMRTDMRL